MLTEAESKALRETLEQKNVNIEKLLQMLGKGSFSELTIADAEYIGQLAQKGKKHE